MRRKVPLASDVAELMKAALADLLKEGSPPPFYVTLVGVNGAMRYWRYDAAGEPETLAQFGGVLEKPIMVMVVLFGGNVIKHMRISAKGMTVH